MASSISLKTLVAQNFLNKLLHHPIRPAAVAPYAARSFNTNAQMRDYDADDRSTDIDRRSDQSISRRRDFPPSLFPDVFDPFSSTRSLSQVLNLMDQFMENPFLSAPRGMGAGSRRGWDAKEDETALFLRIDMPGLEKKDVKVSVEQNTLIIRGEGEKESEDEESVRRYTSRIDLPEKLYSTDQIKAEMKNGVLKVVVPKVKEDERKNVFQVLVE
ncbi:hypothetical protein HHK36_028671 [Tetracentron sinense]|uniref:SHSP domain-containing protein n=1 Tax=Tetracentron sinense TaxID=13715 RepID=A0A834YGP7_TETSI|nr:hypothetical protein HHK36_028671 [Tetracentron sinense]